VLNLQLPGVMHNYFWPPPKSVWVKGAHVSEYYTYAAYATVG